MTASSASCSLSPRLMSFNSCSPAILPTAASCTKLASGLTASIFGVEMIRAPSAKLRANSC